jgi:hypothetical protein
MTPISDCSEGVGEDREFGEHPGEVLDQRQQLLAA